MCKTYNLLQLQYIIVLRHQLVMMYVYGIFSGKNSSFNKYININKHTLNKNLKRVCLYKMIQTNKDTHIRLNQ